MHKAMVLLDIHFKIAYSANFVFWDWLRSGCSEDLFARLILWTPKGGVKIFPQVRPPQYSIQCAKWISGKYGIADQAVVVTVTFVNVMRFHAEWHRQI